MILEVKTIGLGVGNAVYILDKVIDGDTERVNGLPIRMLGIDAPELKQAPWGIVARKYLTDILREKTFSLKSNTHGPDRDRYNRLLRWVFIGDTNINIRMLRDGIAFSYKPKGGSVDYWNQILQAEQDAKSIKLGVWSQARIITPSDWRKGIR